MERFAVKGPVLLKNSIRFEEKFLHEVGQTLQQVAETVWDFSSLEMLRNQLDTALKNLI